VALPNKTAPEWIYNANTKGPRSETRDPGIGGPSFISCGSIAWVGHSNPCRWPAARAKRSNPNWAQATLNAGTCSIDDSALALVSRSMGLHKMVQWPRAWFDVSKWGVLCHLQTLQSDTAHFEQVHCDQAY